MRKGSKHTPEARQKASVSAKCRFAAQGRPDSRNTTEDIRSQAIQRCGIGAQGSYRRCLPVGKRSAYMMPNLLTEAARQETVRDQTGGKNKP